MRRRVAWRRPAAAALLAAACGCLGYTELTPSDRREAQRGLLAGSDRYTRVSLYVTPFFGDDTRRLLSQDPPYELRMVFLPDGEPVIPGPTQKIIPAGTPAKILGVEFPTAWAIANRVTYTPRFQPWVLVGVKGEPADTPLVLVLPANLANGSEVEAAVDRYLSRMPLKPLLGGLTERLKIAIRTKTALYDMTGDVLELTWGYPDEKVIGFDENGGRRETWIYAGGARKAILVGGRVMELWPEPR
ncbi:MAG TPA: hypothetical protein VND93_04665 [Myxococcales bacterium]|nr:hypothetical protein [Myxococcales bacterium]